jgi:hypothetical protein
MSLNADFYVIKIPQTLEAGNLILTVGYRND